MNDSPFTPFRFRLFAILVLCSSLVSIHTEARPSDNSATYEWPFDWPEPVTMNASITSPADFLGFEPGDWHVRYDQLAAYMRLLAAESDRVTLSEYGKSWQGRPLMLLTISDAQNQSRMESLREQHLLLTDPAVSPELDLSAMPVVTWLGYSVHGNEPSGANAALLTAYYLAAAQGPAIDRLLGESIVLLDPVYNPDGLDRFNAWVNNFRSFTPSEDPWHREHREAWPGSRTNHYWFDLNRDWMPVQHPESRGRIAAYQHWKPNVLTDHHEMGTQSTYFFQPGVPERNHPLIPSRTIELTASLAQYHAGFLDQVGQLYWAEEGFDDFYMGKGSTYPDLQGTIGILFEQASSRGHLQQSQHGPLSFRKTIENQLLTSLSTLYGSLDLRLELLEHMRTFYITALEQASRDEVKAWVFGDPYDHARNTHLKDILLHHNIEIYELASSVQDQSQTFEPGQAWVIPTAQPQYRYVKGLFETRTEFADSIFYDVSTWTLPLSFDIPVAELGNRAYSESLKGNRVHEAKFRSGTLHEAPSVRLNDEPRSRHLPTRTGAPAYAYVFEWHDYYAPRAAYRLLDAGIRLKVSTGPFEAQTTAGARRFDYGSIMLSTGIQDPSVTPEKLQELLERIAREDGVDVYAIQTGLTLSGSDLGSSSFVSLRKPSVLLIGGQGVHSNEAGEVWHVLDQRYHIPVTIADKSYLNSVDLDRYNTIVMVNGNYGDLSQRFQNSLEQWLRNGNVLYAQRSAVQWISRTGWVDVNFDRTINPVTDAGSHYRYEDIARLRGSASIGGVIMQAELDRSHPLAFGYKRDVLPVFRNSSLFFEMPENHFAAPVRYTENPLLSGYVSPANQQLLTPRPVVLVGSVGSGRIIMSTDNVNFRAFWFGTNRIFANTLFFGHTIRGDATVN